MSKDDPEYDKKRSAQLSADNKGKSHPHTEESKEKLRMAHLGTHLSEEVKQKISENRKGKCCGVNNPNYRGKAMTKEHYEAHGKLIKEYWKNNPNYTNAKKTQFSSENSSGANNSQAKPVVQLSMDGKLIQTYGYLGEVTKHGFSTPTAVSLCCRGIKDSYKGFKWMYLEDYNKMKEGD